MTLYTIGYAGRPNVPQLAAALPVGWTTLIDVRRTPGCAWNPQYSRRALQTSPLFGGCYQWMPALGNYCTGEFSLPWAKGPDADAALNALARRILAGDTFVLLCAEANYQRCHRRDIADALAARIDGLSIVHL
jgi:uncharacterized protein (DUF488 family)